MKDAMNRRAFLGRGTAAAGLLVGGAINRAWAEKTAGAPA
jgi:hypothetical protein